MSNEVEGRSGDPRFSKTKRIARNVATWGTFGLAGLSAVGGAMILAGCQKISGTQISHDNGPTLPVQHLSPHAIRIDILNKFPVGKKVTLHPTPKDGTIFYQQTDAGTVSFTQTTDAHGKKIEFIYIPYLGPIFENISHDRFTVPIGTHNKLTGENIGSKTLVIRRFKVGKFNS